MPFWIIGAGGVGRESLDVAMALGLEVTGFADDRLAGAMVRDLPVLAVDDESISGGYLVGVADPLARARLASVLAGRGLRPRTMVHPRAFVAPESAMAGGCLVMANAYVSSNVTIGAHSQVQYNATLGHDCVLGERVTMYPGSNVSGSVVLGDGVTIGSNAVVLQGRVIGAEAFVGAGAVVTRDVAPGVVVVGSPARPHSG